MKKLVRLTHKVEVAVEADNEDEIVDWMRQTTPFEVSGNKYVVRESYNEEIIGSTASQICLDIRD